MRKTVAETARVRAAVGEAMNARQFELAITRCGEGFLIDKEAKKLVAEFHEKRAKVMMGEGVVERERKRDDVCLLSGVLALYDV